MPGASADRRHDGHTAAMEPSIAKAVRYARGKATDWHRRDRHDGIRFGICIKIARALAAGHSEADRLLTAEVRRAVKHRDGTCVICGQAGTEIDTSTGRTASSPTSRCSARPATSR